PWPRWTSTTVSSPQASILTRSTLMLDFTSSLKKAMTSPAPRLVPARGWRPGRRQTMSPAKTSLRMVSRSPRLKQSYIFLTTATLGCWGMVVLLAAWMAYRAGPGAGAPESQRGRPFQRGEGIDDVGDDDGPAGLARTPHQPVLRAVEPELFTPGFW